MDKFFGKIESVRMHITTDGNGARRTQYIVQGKDWADAFNQMLYVDPVVGSNILNKLGPLGSASFIFYADWHKTYVDKVGLPSSGEVVEMRVRLGIFDATEEDMDEAEWEPFAGEKVYHHKIYRVLRKHSGQH